MCLELCDFDSSTTVEKMAVAVIGETSIEGIPEGLDSHQSNGDTIVHHDVDTGAA
jgi:hypothetical protein